MTEAQAADMLSLLTWIVQVLQLLLPLVGAIAFGVLAALFLEAVSA